MRIIQINACYGYGSTGTIVRDLQQACFANGIECVVAFSKSKGIVNSGYKMGNTISNKIHALLSRISGKQGYFSIISTLYFLKFLERYKPDIIQIHNLHGCFISLPILLTYARKKKIAVITTFHDCWYYTGGCTHYTSVNCEKWKEKCGKCPRRYQDTPALLWDDSSSILKDRYYYFSKIDNLIGVGVSRWIIEEAQKTIFRNAKCFTIYNGIDTHFFHPIKNNFRAQYKIMSKKIILAPANKWFTDINRDTLNYFSSHLTSDICMVFFGNGCDVKLLTNNMINVGFVSSREAIRELYCAADVLVNCTREESLSLLNIEVQSCGTPVVTYSNTGVRETVDGVCGFAVQNGNYELLWTKVCQILQMGKEYYSNACVEWVKKCFDKEINYNKYIELYKSISF